MKCIAWYGGEDIRIEDVQIPELKEDEVLIKIAYTGICGSDIHVLNGGLSNKEIRFPLILGHEFSGIVSAFGSEVEGLKEGDKVCGNPIGSCGECYFCRNGMENFCTNPYAIIQGPGGCRQRHRGAYAEYIVLKAKQVYKLPENISLKHAALIEPISIAVHCMDKAAIRVGETVVIIGGGSVGQLIMQMARLAGAGCVILSEPNDKRRSVAKSAGADIVVDPCSEDLKEAVLMNTNGLGTEVCIEATGVPALIEQSIGLLKFAGRTIQVGWPPAEKNIQINPFMFYRYELEIKGVQLAPYSFDRAISMVKRLDLEPIITHCFDLTDAMRAFETQKNKDGIKVLMKA